MRPSLFSSVLAIAQASALANAALVHPGHHLTRNDASSSPVSSGRAGGMLLDSFKDSNLDFASWVEEMIANGDLYRPNNMTASSTAAVMTIHGRSTSWTVTLKNVACGTISGNRDTIAKTQEHFCGWVHDAEVLYAQEMETDVLNVLCGTNSVCKMGVRAAFNLHEIFQGEATNDVTNLCHEMFDAINAACPDGGVADADMDDGAGNVQSGQLESSFTLDMSCEASATHECYQYSVPE